MRMVVAGMLPKLLRNKVKHGRYLDTTIINVYPSYILEDVMG